MVQLLLKSNLHQQQYAEQAQKVLVALLSLNRLSDDHLARLWSLTEDATTFEEIKANAYGMLGTLGPHMKVGSAWMQHRAVLCCAVLCCAVLCCAVLCCAVLCCAVLCCGSEHTCIPAIRGIHSTGLCFIDLRPCPGSCSLVLPVCCV